MMMSLSSKKYFLRAMRAPITAARGFWDEANERTQFREQLQLHHTQIIESDDMNIGFLMTPERDHDIQLHTICIVPEMPAKRGPASSALWFQS
jgi:hypothetical protein